MICANCHASAPDGSRFCGSCAAPLPPAPDALTREASATARVPGVAVALAQAPGVGRLASSHTIAVGGFTPGAILADRYRIIGLLGRGGMGEVYRADDLKLGQPVALKFLPHDLASDPVRRERFIGEVRIARQVSHPNLCRVYDIGELDDQYFLTMEYIDGEDLASLLRRIGMLHGPKALDIARQLCAGLAAAHDKGVLHRDLKPANVMIDGRGRVRITDFGLALAAGDSQASDEIAGTPAYMAPEQLAGQAATRASDIHALGLVLYELYTGKRTFTAQTLAELRSQKTETIPVAPSEITRDIDPIVERVIMRCLERDPRRRPSSVAQVAAALPGGDPLAAAIAAGETPSPEMVAASGSSEGFSPHAAWLALTLVIAAVAATVPIMERTMIYRRVALDRPPEALADRARQILTALGHTDPPADSTYGFVADQDLVDYIAKHDSSPVRWAHLPPETIRFFYRQRTSGRLMREGLLRGTFLSVNGMRAFDPPMSTSGDVLVWLDPQGRLLELASVPPELEDPARPVAFPDWAVLFREAGLDATHWTSTAPRYAPAFYADLRAAWVGDAPGRPQDQIHLEAAAHQGTIVSLRRIGPWTGSGRGLRVSTLASDFLGVLVIFVGVAVVALVASVMLARRNLRLGRGDRRGATRLAWAMFGLNLVAWVFIEDHALDPWEIALVLMAIGSALFSAATTWLIYLALEPFVRRRWPHVLISWNRLLLGEFSDPLVGRDLLGGCVLGAASVVVVLARPLVSARLSSASVPPLYGPFELFVTPTRAFLATIFGTAFEAVLFGLVFLFILFLVRNVVRKEWLAVVLFAAVLSSYGLLYESPFLAWLCLFVAYIAVLVNLLRFGLVGFIAGFFLFNILVEVPLTTDPSAWYAVVGFAGVLLVLGVAVAAFVISVGGRPLFGRMALED